MRRKLDTWIVDNGDLFYSLAGTDMQSTGLIMGRVNTGDTSAGFLMLNM